MGETAKTRNNQIKDIAYSAITQLFRNWSSVCEYENVEWGGGDCKANDPDVCNACNPLYTPTG